MVGEDEDGEDGEDDFDDGASFASVDELEGTSHTLTFRIFADAL